MEEAFLKLYTTNAKFERDFPCWVMANFHSLCKENLKTKFKTEKWYNGMDLLFSFEKAWLVTKSSWHFRQVSLTMPVSLLLFIWTQLQQIQWIAWCNSLRTLKDIRELLQNEEQWPNTDNMDFNAVYEEWQRKIHFKEGRIPQESHNVWQFLFQLLYLSCCSIAK